MEIIKNILEIIKANTMKRKIDMPGGRDAYVVLDGSGNETLVVKEEYKRTNEFKVASMSDIVDFATSLPERYGMDRAKAYRELYVTVDSQDIPQSVKLSDKLDGSRKAAVTFAYNEHRDFARWMGAKNMSQLEFRTLLLEQADQHDQPDLAGMLSIIKYKTEINYEASIETERNFKLAFSENEAQGSIDLPKLIKVTCPVISGTAHVENIDFELVIRKPKDASDKIKFSLLPYGKDRSIIFRDAALEVTFAEFIGPVQNALGVFATTMPPIFVREAPKDNAYAESAKFTFLRNK
jgi:hypothetical protein